MKIGIFGGTFNPIHLGHVNAIGEAKMHFDLDKVIVIPAAQSPHKTDKPIKDSDRVEMIKRATKYLDFVEIDSLELERSGVSYTYDTMLELMKRHVGAELYFIMGEDQYNSFDKWHNYEELLELANFIVLRRSGSNIRIDKPFLEKETRVFEVSSSEIRKRIKLEQQYSHLLNEQVYTYIKEHNLYEEK
ncbi:nicotinate-nucleotide adenylyltransferase [Phocicoccus pinnipedialis]|uniref:Probable nicotinate-nucleotide adenylyltransferase n=1 Tax=Phocicoccus pinnipedialis TaxID=110845 RepID=A0A6V7RFG8_9BACL|nr:nicotinate-nucleotide adenylyltransferase [Jeotgalicoccus pinnipedialis]MBP1939239.1 nicotinate-nucleotide adenylyltransferase [Jeotgalicoccus pinnipedialis]CAD2076178.1 Nicotinate-nucleotide adenylyltransferase [Jeotgalicoccus pinnipedialis]